MQRLARWIEQRRYPHLHPWTTDGPHSLDSWLLPPAPPLPRAPSSPSGASSALTNVSQVIDEADRLLNQSFHDWLPSILAALKPPVTLTERNNGETTADVLAPEWWDASVGRVESDLDERCFASVRSFLPRGRL